MDGEIIIFSKEYKFESQGIHNVQFLLYSNNINMDNMFKDVSLITSVEMTTNKNIKITSMISTFENCENLNDFSIQGFNTEEIKSLSKLFYNSNILLILI